MAEGDDASASSSADHAPPGCVDQAEAAEDGSRHGCGDSRRGGDEDGSRRGCGDDRPRGDEEEARGGEVAVQSPPTEELALALPGAEEEEVAERQLVEIVEQEPPLQRCRRLLGEGAQRCVRLAEEPPVPALPPRLARLRRAAQPPRVDCVGLLMNLPRLYCEKLGQYPWAFLLFHSLMLVVVICVAWRPVVVNADLDGFRRVDCNATMFQSVYEDASLHLRALRNDSTLSDRTTFKLELFYEAHCVKESGCEDRDREVFSEAALRDIRAFEHRLRNLDGWRRLCDRADPRARFRCEPGESMGNYMWPTRRDAFLGHQGFFRLVFDGTATERLPVPATLAYLSGEAAAPHSPQKFLPQEYPQQRSLLRSIFTFTAPSLDDADFRREHEAFVIDELYPALLDGVHESKREVDPDEWEEPLHIRIYFSGDGVNQHEVRITLESDVRYAAGAMVLAFLVSWLHLRSFFLGLTGTAILCCSALLTHVVVSFEELGLATFLSVFLVVGLGSGALFHINDHWRRSYHAHPSLTDRLMSLHVSVGLQLLPVVLSDACYFAYYLSLMRPLREFGLFTGVCMNLVCLLCVLIFIPLLVFHERDFYPCIARKAPKLALVLEPRKLEPPWKTIATHCFSITRRFYKQIIGGYVVVALLAFIMACTFAATREQPGLPEIFAPSHHRSAGRPLERAFLPTRPADDSVALNATFCEPGRDLGRSCGLHWCEAPLAPAPEEAAPDEAASDEAASDEAASDEAASDEAASDGADSVLAQCQCHRELNLPHDCRNLTVRSFLSGSSAAALSDDQRVQIVSDYLQQVIGFTSGFAAADPSSAQAAGFGSARSRRLPDVVLEHWESGATNVEPFLELAPLHGVRRFGSTACTIRAICHCGPRTCNPPAGFSQDPHTVELQGEAERRLTPAMPTEGARRLSPLAFEGQSNAGVVIVFGIKPPEGSFLFDVRPEWSFDPDFDPTSPGAQRAMLQMCTNLPSDLDVVGEPDCWIITFREWLLARGEQFPVRRFGDVHGEMQSFMNAYPSSTQNMWLNEDGNLRATAFHLKVAPGSSAQDVLQHRQRWLDYAEARRREFATTAGSPWVTAQVWVDAEAYDEALSSSYRVVLLALLVITVVGLLYTGDFEIMFIIMVLSVAACALLSFFMYCIFQWAFGPWELAITTVILCYSVEPAFRIGRDFVHPPPEAEGSAGDATGEHGDPCTAEDAVTPLPIEGQPDPETGLVVCTGSMTGGNDACDTLSRASSPREDQNSTGMIEYPSCTGKGADDASKCSEGAESIEKVSTGSPKGRDLESFLQRSVYLAMGTLTATSLKLILCGIFLLPCEFRLFTRLGAVAVLVPFISVPATLVLLPAVMLATGRQRREPDFKLIGQYCMSKLAWLGS